MPDRRTPRQRKAARQRARARRQHAEAERRREQHARLVARRSGDLRFVQRPRHADGSVWIGWPAGGPHDAAIREALAGQKAAFRAKFGREMAPDDPVFFDPDAEPVALTEPQFTAALAAVAAGLDPAAIRAWQDVGYIVTEGSQHPFSAADVEPASTPSPAARTTATQTTIATSRASTRRPPPRASSPTSCAAS
jgi:hypothetical protein